MSARKNITVLLIIVYATMIIFGLIENIKGVTFPLIKDTFNVTYDAQGVLVSFSWFGYVFFCIVATFSIQKLGIKISIIFGYICLFLGCLAILLAPNFIIVTLALAILWMGFGFFEIGNNALATSIFTSKSALFMSLMHGFYGLGAIIGPIYAGHLSENLSYSFKDIYMFTLIPIIIVLFIILTSKFKVTHDETNELPSLTIKMALQNKYVWLFSLALGFMEVIEFGAANWGAFYLRDVFNIDPLTLGAFFVSIFYTFFTLSRLISGFGIEKIGYLKSIIISLILILILYIIGFSIGKNGMWVLSSTGLFIAILWPTVMSYAIKVFGINTPIASSVIIVISGIINGMMQLGTGLINEYIGPEWGYRLNTFYVLISLFTLLIINKTFKKESNLIV
ncbi:MAG: putative major facilitator superfamily 1 [Haloplasmataceae bacterium]|nr:putative major facilitator superfamily 1 [Haloplasmataceae bacterium]